jgi:hypothetical protein
VNGLESVRSRQSLLDRNLRLVGAFVLGGLLVAIVKPWGSDGTSPAAVFPTNSPSPSLELSPQETPFRLPGVGFNSLAYDARIFGDQEPPAVWAIWPAGYLVTFGFVIQVENAPAASPDASPGSTSIRSPDLGPSWPARFEVPLGNHLFLIGVNMPRGFSMSSARLTRLKDPGSDVGEREVSLIRLESPWPTHFAVLGIPGAPNDGRLAVWDPGTYLLELGFEPGNITRTLEIAIAQIGGGPVSTPTAPVPSEGP